MSRLQDITTFTDTIIDDLDYFWINEIGTSTATLSIASPCVVTKTSHGLEVGNKISFTTSGTLPTGITASTEYYIISTGFGTNSFQISATYNGTAINTSGTQSGTHTYVAYVSKKMSGLKLKSLVNSTNFNLDSTFEDAQGNKVDTISRTGSIKVRENNTTLSKFAQLLSYGLTILSDTYAQIYQTTVSATVYPLTRMTRKRGTITSQTNAETGDTLGMIAWSGGSNDSALIFAQATENHTGNVGTTLYFQTAQTGSSGLNTVMWVDGNGRANFPIGINPQIQSVSSSATVTPTSLNDLVKITAQATGLTLANPTGTFSEGQALMIRIKDSGTAQTIAFDTNYRAIGVTLPTTTVISKTMYLGIIYNSTDAKWDIIGYNIQA